MANPDKYVVGYSFGDYQSTNPSRPLPGPALDNELFDISTSLGETIDGLEDIRRSDGKLQNRIVTSESLATDLLMGIGAPTPWQTNTAYAPPATVFNASKFYICAVAHTSGISFDPTKWTQLADLTAGASDSGAWFAGVDTVKTVDYTILVTDAGKMLVANKATAINFTFADTSTLGTGIFLVRNVGVGALTLAAASGQSIEGVANPSGLAVKTGWMALVWVAGSSLRAQLFPAPSDLVKGASPAVSGNFPAFGANGNTLVDSGVSPSNLGSFSQLPELVKTADYTVQTADSGSAVIANKSTAITFTLPTVASASGGVYFFRNIGVGLLTLDGNGSETIEGATTLPVKQGCAALLWSTGGAWRAFAVNRVATTAEAQAGTATGVYMDPATTAAAILSQEAVIQRAYAEYTTFAALATLLPADDTVPLSTEGTQILSQSFTPKSAASTIRVSFFAFAGGGSGPSNTSAALFQGSTCLDATTTIVGSNVSAVALATTVEVPSGSTSSRTYSVRVGNNAGNAVINGSGSGRIFGGSARAVLIVEEIH